MNLWLTRLKEPVPAGLETPAELARFELSRAFPDVQVELAEQSAMGEGYRIDPLPGGSIRITGGSTGVLYGAYRLILDRFCGETAAAVESAPKYALRMIDCWDNPDGTIERGYAGHSLFFRDLSDALYCINIPFHITS